MESVITQEPGKSNGPIVGIIVVLIVLALGAYFLFGQLSAQQAMPVETGSSTQTTDDAGIAELESQLNTNDTANLEAEMEADFRELETQ